MDLAHESDGLTPARLRAVLAVAETGSFSTAARIVGSSQSNVSRAVAAVEAIVEAHLFDRSTRSVRLTEAGREFVERAMVVTSELDAAVRSLRPERRPSPRLVLASLTSVSELHLPGALATLDEPMPRFRCIEGLQAMVEASVAGGRADAGIGDLADVSPELGVRPMWVEPFRLALPTTHRLARRRKVTIDELAGEPLVGFSRDAELRSTVDRELAAARRLRTPDIVVDRYRTALAMVLATGGVMVVPSIVRPGLPAGVKLVDLDHPELHRTMGVLHRPDRPPTPLLERVLERVVEAVSATPEVVVQ
ncbi:MAG: LysR family transcriptional regulator [Actinomycetota bacterium]